MTHIITTYGGGELFSLIFNGIAALFKQDSTGMVMPLIRVGLMTGLLYTVILMFFRSSLIEGFHWLLWVVIATNLLFLPKTTVYIHDPLTKARYKVDHVPLSLGAFAGFVSHIGKTITEKVEAVFTLPDYMPYHKTGTVFASSLMKQVGQFRIVDPLFRGNMERFVNQCIVYDVMIGHKYTLSDLQNSPDIWKLVNSKASPVLGFLYRDGKNPGSIVTCKTGAQKLNALWTEEIKKAMALYGKRVQNQTLTESAFQTSLLGSVRLFSASANIAGSAMDLLRQEMMIHALEDASNNKLSELGSPSNYASTKALLQQRSTYAIAGDIAARTLPLFKNVIESLSYALFIFIVVLALLPNGYRILLTYFGILVWTQLWAPLYAVLNLIISLYGKSETHHLIGNAGLTLLNSSALINAHADMVTLAAWLAISIPFISYGILKQGASAFVGLAHHLGSAMQSSASGVAAEAVSGNVSLGNVSLGTEAYQNTSAFQHHTSPIYAASQFKGFATSGLEHMTFGDGSQTVHDHKVPQLPFTLMATYSSSQETQQRLSEAQTLSQTMSIAAGESMDSALQQSSNLLQKVSSDISTQDHYSKSLNTNESKALQEHTNFTKDLSESLGVSQARASDIALAVKAGTPEWIPVSAGVSNTTSGSTSHQEHYQKAETIAKQKGYTYSLDSVLSAAHSLMESKNDMKGADLATGAQASLNKARHLREEVSLAQAKVQEASEAHASGQRHDFQESRNITQPFLEYVARQPVNNGPEHFATPIGMKRAVSVLKEGGEEYQVYLDGFQKENPQYTLERVQTSEVHKGFETQYQSQVTSLKSNESSFGSQYQHHIDSIEQQGKDLGLNNHGSGTQKGSDSAIKAEFQQKQAEAEIRLEAHSEGFTLKESTLQEKVDKERDKNIVAENIKQAGGQIYNTGKEVYDASVEIVKSEHAPQSERTQKQKSQSPLKPPPQFKENKETFPFRENESPHKLTQGPFAQNSLPKNAHHQQKIRKESSEFFISQLGKHPNPQQSSVPLPEERNGISKGNEKPAKIEVSQD